MEEIGKGCKRGAGNSRCNEFSLSHDLMWLAVICFSLWPGLPDGSMSPFPTFGPEWFKIPASNPLSKHMPPPLTLPGAGPTTRSTHHIQPGRPPVPCAPCILTPMAPMAPMAWSPPRTSLAPLAPLAPLPPSTPMMVRRVVTVSPLKMPPPTFVSGAVPAPPVYGMPVTRTVRYAGRDWGNQQWVRMATAVGVVCECS